MVAAVIIVFLALPVVGGVIGFIQFAMVGGVMGAAAGLTLAVALVVGPFVLLMRAEKAKAAAPRAPPPDVPWL